MNFFRRAVFLFLVACVSCATLMAQTPGSLRGQVLDPSGAAVPKAAVTVTGPNGLVKVAVADNDGAYAIAGLPAGQYTIRVTATGFTLYEKAGVELTGGRPATLNINLSVEGAKQEVTVADTQDVDLDPAKNAGALVLKQEDLDMLSDDPDDLQADLLALAGPAAGPNGGQIFIDGFSNGQLPPKESIREIRINSNPFSAEYDTSGRGRIEILTKPGTGNFHGTVNINYSDWLFNARNPFITSPNFSVPASDTKNLQANLSGPIIKNKLSFFVDFSRRQQREDSLINANVLDSSCTALAFGTSCSPVTQAYAIIAPNTFDSISPRIDYQLSPNITLQGRYTWHGNEQQQAGVGTFNLPSTAYTNHGRNQVFQLTETQVVNTSTINETRFQYVNGDTNQLGVEPGLNISVADAFTTGSSFDHNYTHTGNYELQNYTTITHGAHFIKFGARLRLSRNSSYLTSDFNGQFNFDSLSSYAILQQGLAQGVPLATIFASSGQPYQYVFNSGQPLISASQVDAGLFYQDDWRVRPNLTLSLGLRYEVQNNIPDHGDWAPRIGLAWGIGPSSGRGRAPKTVLRAGFGYFYDRFSLSNVINTERYNGVNQVQYTISSPQFYQVNGQLLGTNGQAITQQSLISPANEVSSATYHLGGDYQSPRMQQAAIGLDRQLPKNVTISVNYINSIGTHIVRTVNINTPLLGTWNPLNPTASVYPLGQAAGIYNLYESGGMYRQNQLMVNGNARINSRISIFGFYVYGHVNSNVAGASANRSGGPPSNPFNFNEDWGRASYDIHNMLNVNGSILTLWGIRMSPNIAFNSAPPVNIYEGIDQYGDTLTNARPALATPGLSLPACTPALARGLTPCLVSGTPYGNFVINPGSLGLPVIPVNAFNGFRQFNFNLRISRTWGFGEPSGSANQRQRPGGGGPPGGGFGGGMGRGGGRGPGGPGGMFGGGESTGKRYNLTAGIFFHNLFNTVNPGAVESNLLSSRIGDPLNQANIGGFGGNQAAQAFNRRIDLSLRFQF